MTQPYSTLIPTPPAPAAAPLCRVYGRLIRPDGKGSPFTRISFRSINSPTADRISLAGSSLVVDPIDLHVVTNRSGDFYVDLLRGSVVSAGTANQIHGAEFTVPDQGLAAYGDLVRPRPLWMVWMVYGTTRAGVSDPEVTEETGIGTSVVVNPEFSATDISNDAPVFVRLGFMWTDGQVRPALDNALSLKVGDGSTSDAWEVNGDWFQGPPISEIDGKLLVWDSSEQDDTLWEASGYLTDAWVPYVPSVGSDSEAYVINPPSPLLIVVT